MLTVHKLGGAIRASPRELPTHATPLQQLLFATGELKYKLKEHDMLEIHYFLQFSKGANHLYSYFFPRVMLPNIKFRVPIILSSPFLVFCVK